MRAIAFSLTGDDEVRLSLNRMQDPVQRELDEISRPLPSHLVEWAPYFRVYCFVVIGLLVAVSVVSPAKSTVTTTSSGA